MGSRALAVLCLVAVLLVPALAVAGGDDDGGCEAETAGRDKPRALRLKIIAIFCILAGSAIGAGVPSLGRQFPALRPETDLFLAVKAFAGGVILATGLVHILPAAFAGLVAMLAAVATLIVDTVATGYFHRTNAKRAAAVTDEPALGDLESTFPRPRARDDGAGRPARRRRAGAPPRHLSGAGAGRGGALAHHRHVAGRLRLPEHGAAAGPGVDVPPALRGHRARRLHRSGQVPAQVRGGHGGALLDDDAGGDRRGDRDIQRVRRDQPDGVVVQGLLEAAAAEILAYMALVDILAEDFSKARVQSRARLQLALNVSLLLGAGLMSLLAVWA